MGNLPAARLDSLQVISYTSKEHHALLDLEVHPTTVPYLVHLVLHPWGMRGNLRVQVNAKSHRGAHRLRGPD
jgi:hypothetical protein